MPQQIAVKKLLYYITEHGFELEYEMEMSFLDLEEEQTNKAYYDGVNDGRNNTLKYKYFEYKKSIDNQNQ